MHLIPDERFHTKHYNTFRIVAEHFSARYLILQYNLAMGYMYVSHALECNYNCGEFHYIIDDC